MAQFANVIAVSYKAPNPFLDVVVQIRKGIYNASTNGNADFGLLVTVTYVAGSGDVVTLSTGRVSIKTGTTFVSNIDNRTVAVSLQVQLGANSPPAAGPSYSATAQVVQRDNASSADVELGEAEQTFP